MILWVSILFVFNAVWTAWNLYRSSLIQRQIRVLRELHAESNAMLQDVRKTQGIADGSIVMFPGKRL